MAMLESMIPAAGLALVLLVSTMSIIVRMFVSQSTVPAVSMIVLELRILALVLEGVLQATTMAAIALYL
jgi:hypothetical protein